MRIKSKFLIGGAIFALIALTSMQGYLTFNTYDLRKKSFAVESRTKIGSILQNKLVDSLSWAYRMEFIHKIPDYKNGKISKQELLETLSLAAEKNNGIFLKHFKQGAKINGLDEKILFKKEAASIVLIDEYGNREQLVSNNAKGPIFLLGNHFPSQEGLLINAWNWNFDEGYINENNDHQTMVVEYKANLYMKIVDWNQTIFKQLLLLFLIAFLLFAFTITLVAYSINNLIKQKRISDVKTDFINNITHELKTPLATLSIAVKTLNSKFAKDNKDIAQESLDTINRQNKRLQNLIDQVVDYSLGHSEIDLNLETVRLSDFLSQLLDDYQLTLTDDVQLLRDIEKNDLEIDIDTFALGTALVNILNNAVKYGGTVIKLQYHTQNHKHIIAISDNGIGISEKNKKLIFDKFYRVSEQNRHTYKGLGLGLYYCDQIVKAHHGELEVKSQIKEGSTFYLKLPMHHGKENLTGR